MGILMRALAFIPFLFLSHAVSVHADYSGCEDECNVSAHFDLLFWKAREKSLVLTNETSPVFFTDDFTLAKVLHPEFHWNLGYRIGVDYLLPCTCWQATLDWTHYNTSISQHRVTNSNDLTNRNNQEGMFPIWALSPDIIAGDYVSEAHLNGKLNLNLIDLDFGHHIACANCFEIKPYIGLRTAFINQHAKIHYNGGIFLTTIIEGGVSLNGTDRIHLKNNFWGMGPRLGIKPEFFLANGFSLYGDAAIAGLLGEFSLDQKETYLDVERFSHHKNFVRFQWIGDLAAGVAWKTCLFEYLLTFKLGWEYHIFFQQLKLKGDSFHLISHDRNLDVQGVTFSSQMEF